MVAALLVLYIGLFIFALNGLIFLGMLSQKKAMKVMEEDLIRMIIKIRLRKRGR